MNTKLKIALLTMLGFSTAACCGTKKASKSAQDAEPQPIEADGTDPRVMLMYGVPLPDGQTIVAVDENGKPIEQEAQTDGVAFPDGRIVKPISEEEAKARIEELNAAEQKEQEAQTEDKE